MGIFQLPDVSGSLIIRLVRDNVRLSAHVKVASKYMAARSKTHAGPKAQPETLKGWKQIAEFLGEPVSVVQRWATEGMPVSKEGRFVSTSPERLNAWLGCESGKPVHVVAPDEDLMSELKREVAYIRQHKKTG